MNATITTHSPNVERAALRLVGESDGDYRRANKQAGERLAGSTTEAEADHWNDVIACLGALEQRRNEAERTTPKPTGRPTIALGDELFSRVMAAAVSGAATCRDAVGPRLELTPDEVHLIASGAAAAAALSVIDELARVGIVRVVEANDPTPSSEVERTVANLRASMRGELRARPVDDVREDPHDEDPEVFGPREVTP